MGTLPVRVALLAGVLAARPPATSAVPASSRPPAEPPPSADCRANSTFRVGAGIYDITGPAAELGIMGYAKVEQKTEGIHLRLFARAFVVESPCNGQRVAVVSADLGQLFQSVHQGVLAKLRAAGLPYDQSSLLLSATHTHGGPGGYSHYALYNLTVMGFDRQNFEAITEGIYQAIHRAHDNLAEGRIYLNRGELSGASKNRSLPAYEKNPAAERAGLPSVDTEMTLLRFDAANGTAVGAINWFAVHGTSMSNRNRLITGDNKGYASYLFEKRKGADYRQARTFVGAFAQSNEGDVTPNVFEDPEGRGRGDFDATERSGRLQFAKAWELYDKAKAERPVTGPVDIRFAYVTMSDLTVAPAFADGRERHTCRGAIGAASFAGAEDGPGFGNEGLDRDAALDLGVAMLGQELLCKAAPNPCHFEKPIALDLCHGSPSRIPLTPEVLPLQIVRVGNVALVAVPFELTTMAGRRLRRTVLDELGPVGVDTAVIAGLANAYAGYVTTREEYAAQHYEGASTHFGPWTLASLRQEFTRLARAMAQGHPVPPGPAPRDLSREQSTLQTGVVADPPPPFGTFGAVAAQDVLTLYRPGDTVRVAFWGAHPKNDLRTQGSFLEVQRQGGQRQQRSWVTLGRDGDWETRFQWEREGVFSASRITVVWNIPPNAQHGAYRIQHSGRAKKLDGTFLDYSGTSNVFYVVSPAAANAIRKAIDDGGQPCTSDQACAGGGCIRPFGSPTGYCGSPLAGCKAARGRTPGCACSAKAQCGSGRCEYGLCVPQGCKLPPQECRQDDDCCGRPWSAVLSCRTYLTTPVLTVRTCAP